MKLVGQVECLLELFTPHALYRITPHAFDLSDEFHRASPVTILVRSEHAGDGPAGLRKKAPESRRLRMFHANYSAPRLGEDSVSGRPRIKSRMRLRDLVGEPPLFGVAALGLLWRGLNECSIPPGARAPETNRPLLNYWRSYYAWING